MVDPDELTGVIASGMPRYLFFAFQLVRVFSRALEVKHLAGGVFLGCSLSPCSL
jgi:hypothetical protein